MKFLGIHSRAVMVASPTSLWSQRATDIRSRGHNIYLPQFDVSEDPRYELWATTLEDIDIDQYDGLIAVGYGCAVLARYLKENKIHMKRVLFCSPGRESKERHHMGILYDFLENNEMNLEEYIEELYIIHGLNDEIVPYSEGEKFQKQIGGELIELEGFGHELDQEALTYTNDLLISGE